MAPTFYGVLGVGPDADAEAIERGYRERVTEVHPDVNDDPDADAQFKRLTTARDALLDDEERSRYDRLGHASYVRHHVTCSAWQSTVAGETDDAPGDEGTDSGRSETQGSTEQPSSTADSGSARRDRRRSSGADRERRQRTGPGGTRNSRSRDWNTGRRKRERTTTSTARSARSTDDAGSGASAKAEPSRESARAGSTATAAGSTRGGTDREESGWSSGDERDGRRRSGTGSAGDTGGEATYATSSFWETQRVGERFGTKNTPRIPLSVRLLRGIQALGVWALIHLVFLAAAVGTSWYVYAVVLDASTASLPLLIVLVGEVVLAATLSSLHVLTRIYR